MAETDPQREYEHYRDEARLQPQGPPRERKSGLSEMLPIRLTPDLLGALRARARGDERSVSWVVRRAIERHLGSSEDVGWLLPEAVLDPVYRPVKEAAEAMKILQGAAEQIMAEEVGPAQASPLAEELADEDRLAGAWGEHPVYEVFYDAKLRLAYGIEHLESLRRLSSPPIAFFSAAAVARALLESSVRSWWVLDPSIDARTRVAHGMTERLHSLRNQRTVAHSFQKGSEDDRDRAAREVEERIASIEASAEQHGFALVGQGRDLAVGEGRKSTTELVADFCGQYTETALSSLSYRLWSAITQGTGWEADLFSDVQPGDKAGFETETLTPRPAHVRMLMRVSALSYLEALDRLVRYSTGSSEGLGYLKEIVVSKLFIPVPGD